MPRDGTLAERLAALLGGFAGAHGTYESEDWNADKGKFEIKRTAKTLREPATLALWIEHLEGRRPLGIIPTREDESCVWGCVDIDQYDVNHAELADRVAKTRAPLVVARSKSGGAYVFIFLAEPEPAADVASVMRQVAAALGHGGSEIYPKQARILAERGDLGSWLNMPYFGEWADGGPSKKFQSLGRRGGVKRTGAAMSLGEFVEAAEAARTTTASVRVGRKRRENEANGHAVLPEATGAVSLDEGPPCLEIMAESGFPDGTRNNGLFALGVFAKKKYGSRWKEVLEEFNQSYMNPPLPAEEVALVERSLEKKEYFYRCKDEPCVSHCNSVLCRTRRYGVGWSDSFPLLSGMSVLNSDPPIWFVDVEGVRMELTTSDLQEYKRFHKICMEQLKMCFQMLKQDTWLRMVALAMRDAIQIEVPPDAGVKGQFAELLEDFLTNRHRGERQEDILSGRPFEWRGRHHFRLRDLQAHLERAGFRAYTRNQMASKIKDAGGGSLFWNVAHRGVNIWWVPATFERADPAVVDHREDRESI